MGTTRFAAALRRLHGSPPDAADGELVERFASQRDEAAFESLVQRHGPMVLGVCRRVLRNPHDAEDAFQATFVVLARKAGSVHPPAAVGGWLHGVAYHTALKAKAMNDRRRVRERQAAARRVAETPAAVWDDLREVLDCELQALPEQYRIALVLCDLEGQTVKEAARQLGCPQGTLAGRLARGRELLSGRLCRRGITLSAAGLAAVLGREASAAVAPMLLDSTVRAAAGALSPRVAALKEGALFAMLGNKLKIASGVLVVIVCLAAVAAFTPAPTAAQEQRLPPPRPTYRAFVHAPATAQKVWKERAALKGHRGAVMSVSFGDGILASASLDEVVKLWDLDTGKELASFNPVPKTVDPDNTPVGLGWVKFRADGKLLAIGGRETGGTVIRDFSEKRTGGRTVGAVGFGAGPPRAADAQLKFWAFADGKQGLVQEVEPDFDAKSITFTAGRPPLDGHTGDVNAAAFSPDSKTLATASEDKTVKLWDVETSKELATLSGYADGVSCVRFSPDGKTLAAGGKDATVRLWDPATSRELAKFECRDVPWCLAFSPDGKLLAVGSNDNTVELWDPATGKKTATLKGHSGPVRSVAFSQDGKTLATASDDHTVKLWELGE